MKKPSRSSKSQLKHRQGFTLVEVLVSSLLTLIVMGMLFAVLMGTINAWESGTARLRSSGDARLAMDIIKTDLESMVVRQTSYNQEWMVSYPVKEDGTTSTWLTFFAPSLDREEGQDGDIVALSYRVAFQDPISIAEISPIYGLYKAMATTTNTFQNVLGQPNIISGYWADTNLVDPAPKERKGFLAPNVVKFDIAWWVQDLDNPTNPLKRFGPEYVVRLGNQLKIGINTPVPVNGKIEAVDVTITSVSNEGMRRYAFFVEHGQETPAKLAQVIQQFGRVHTLRVSINY